MNLLIFFIVLNIINVILQTVKTIVTANGNKWSASVVNAIAYGAYTVLLVYMTCDLTLFEKVVVVGLCNLVGVFVVKLIEEKMRKDKLWKIECTVNSDNSAELALSLESTNIPFNYFKVSDKHVVFNIYSANQSDSMFVKTLIAKHNAKYFASETKIL